MGRIVVTEFISVDGVIEAPGGGEDYSRGGWAFDYEGFAAAWPVLLGEGKRLFPAGQAKRPLTLTEAKTVGDGVSILRFEPKQTD